MVTIIQRATVGWYVLSLIILFGVACYRYPSRIMPLLLLILGAVIAFSPFVMEVLSTLTEKTELVGLNMRAEELAAVIKQVSVSPFHMLFGLGWGGEFSSPAVGGVTVNFTHSLITAMWLKTGLVGVILLAFYLYRLFDAFMPQLTRKPILFFALSGPVLIDLFLYASYKSLDFGLILLLVAVYSHHMEEKSAGNIANSSPVVASA